MKNDGQGNPCYDVSVLVRLLNQREGFAFLCRHDISELCLDFLIHKLFKGLRVMHGSGFQALPDGIIAGV